MPTITYGEWLPDQPRLGNACITATNVYPVANGYKHFPSASAITDALPASCVGRISFRRSNGVREVFAGTESGLYRKNGESWDDVSGASYAESTFWRFAVYGDRLIATNGVDNPQKFDLSSSSTFSDLSNAPVHRYPIVVRDVLVALDVQDGSSYNVKWSAVNDSESWDAASGGGSQLLPDGGPIAGGTGGEFGVVLQEFGLTRMNFVGGDLRFTFDKIEGSVGTKYPGSIVGYKGRTFYYSEEGFQVFGGAESRNISDEKVSDYFLSQLSPTSRVTDVPDTRITDASDARVISRSSVFIDGALDSRNSCVVWSYPGPTANQLIIYNYALDRWSSSSAAIDCLFQHVSPSGDFLAGFDGDNKLATFSGSDLSATVSTGDLRISEDVSFVRSVRGLVDAAHTVTVGVKTDLADTESTVSANSSASGKCSLRARGRYHRFQTVPTAAFTELSGVIVEAVKSGGRA